MLSCGVKDMVHTVMCVYGQEMFLQCMLSCGARTRAVVIVYVVLWSFRGAVKDTVHTCKKDRGCCCSVCCGAGTGTVAVAAVYVVVRGQGLLLLLQCMLSCGVLAGQTMEGTIEVKKNRKDPRSLDIRITLDGKSHDYFMD